MIGDRNRNSLVSTKGRDYVCSPNLSNFSSISLNKNIHNIPMTIVIIGTILMFVCNSTFTTILL